MADAGDWRGIDEFIDEKELSPEIVDCMTDRQKVAYNSYHEEEVMRTFDGVIEDIRVSDTPISRKEVVTGEWEGEQIHRTKTVQDKLREELC